MVSNESSENTVTTEPAKSSEPLDLTGVVYTDSEIEIFWERSTDARVVKYTVSRDAEVLTTIDALSYYDSTVEPGTTYEYTLQTVNSDGVLNAGSSRRL